MSKSIIIQEGGLGKQLTADKLRTNLVGGGSCLWVPEDDTRLGTKYISANGTYKASDDGYYGYSQVTVSGVGTATGKDGDGDQAQTTTDPTTGDLVTEKLIERIAITTPPTTTEYHKNDTINFSGLVVHGYSSTGRDLGVIPINELAFPVTTATGSDEWSATSDITPSPVTFTRGGGHVIISNDGGTTRRDFDFQVSPAEVGIINYEIGNNLTIWVKASKTNFDGAQHVYTHDGKPIYVCGESVRLYWSVIEGYPSPSSDTSDAALWTCLYGDVLYGRQAVPVKYVNKAGAELEASFDIEVVP